ncbi:MAG: hypothetical protein DRJ43_00010 [Thermoprotei archaeon]|nr:MAG: hypothetical protein DRJ43_00010 [Thermoprotei archaeon]
MEVVVINKPGHPVPYIGGVEVYSYNLALHLAKLGIEIYYISMFKKISQNLPSSLHLIKANLPLYRGGREGTFYWLLHYITGALSYVKAFLRKVPKDIDIVHVNDGLTAFLMSKLKKVMNFKLVLTLHAPPPWLVRYGKPEIIYKMAYITLYIPGILASDLIICVGQKYAENLKKTFPRLHNKVVYLPNAIDNTIFKPATKEEIEKVKAKYGIKRDYFLFVGRLVKEKGIDILLRAALLLEEKGFDKDIVIVGTGPLKSLAEKYSKKCKIIKYLGYVPTEDLVPLYTGAIALIVPSYAEGLPLTILESIACGTPIISTNILDIGEVLRKYSWGRTFPIGDYIMLATIIMRGDLDNIKIRNKSLSHVVWTTRVKEIVKLYEKKVYHWGGQR